MSLVLNIASTGIHPWVTQWLGQPIAAPEENRGAWCEECGRWTNTPILRAEWSMSLMEAVDGPTLCPGCADGDD